MQFENTSKWTQTIRPICLPKGDEKFENGNMCMVAGWGATETHSVSRFVSIVVPGLDSNVFKLRYTIIPKLPTAICDSWLFSKLDYNVEFHGPSTPAGPGSCGFDRGWSLVVI